MTDADVYSRYFQLCEEAGLLASLSFELTDACNFACTHCYRLHGSTFLDRGIFLKALGEAEEMGALLISFNGGEPTLHPEFLSFAREVLRRGLHLTVLTNAYRLAPDTMDELALWAQNVHFQISIYGVDNASGAAITGVQDAHERAFANACAALARGFSVKVALLALQSTAAGMANLVARLNAAQIPHDLMLFLSAREDGDVSIRGLAPDEDAMRGLLQLKSEMVSVADPLDPDQKWIASGDVRACGAGVTALAVRADGRILPCQVFYSGHVWGQEPKNSLQEAFASPQRQEFLQANRVPEKCRACGDWQFCQRCPADVFNETGGLANVPPSICRLARLWHEWESKKSVLPP